MYCLPEGLRVRGAGSVGADLPKGAVNRSAPDEDKNMTEMLFNFLWNIGSF